MGIERWRVSLWTLKFKVSCGVVVPQPKEEYVRWKVCGGEAAELRLVLAEFPGLVETLRESYLVGSFIQGLEEVVLVTEDCLWQPREGVQGIDRIN